MTRGWRQVHYSRPRIASLRWLRHQQRGLCAYCQRAARIPPRTEERIEGALYASRDHMKPRALGGSDERWNLVMACEPCNNLKGAMDWTEWQEFMRENPRWWETQPAGATVTTLQVAQLRNSWDLLPSDSAPE